MKKFVSMATALGLITAMGNTATADEEEPRVKIVHEIEEAGETAVEEVEQVLPIPGGAWSTQGGEIVPLSQYGGTVGVGYPGLRGMIHIPILRDFEVAPTFWFFFARNTAIVAGDTFSVLLKYRVYQAGQLHISLAADPGVVLDYYKAFGVVVQLGFPQLLMTYNLMPEVDLHFGFKMPIYFSVHPAFCTWIPFLFNFGAEYHFNDWINIFGTMDMGLVLRANNKPTVFFSPNFLLGAAFKF